MVRAGGFLKLAVLVFAFLLAVFFVVEWLDLNMDFKVHHPPGKNQEFVIPTVTAQPGRSKCGLSQKCPADHFHFKIVSGAANVVGPRICLEDEILMSNVMNNVGRGMNIALINGKTGHPGKTQFFDMWVGEVAPLIKFLKEIENGTIVMMASYDDAATKLNDEARNLIAELGSSLIHSVRPRDNWTFVGGKGIKTKSPFEQHMKNSADTNKFDGWPEVVEMKGCIPRKQN